MAVSSRVLEAIESSSWVRAMFEVGLKLKKEHGADKVLDLSLGNPDLEPPQEFSGALSSLLEERTPHAHSYMPNGGYPEVREEIAGRVQKEYGVDTDGRYVVMSCGAGGGLNVTFKSILNPGDRVLTQAPYFMEYRWYVDNHRGTLEPLGLAEGFDLDVDRIADRIGPDVAAVLINVPNNPSGRIYSESTISALGNMLDERSKAVGRRIYLVSDEPYREIVYDGASVPSVFSHYEHSIVVSSYSKTLSIPGERIGWIAVDPRAEDADTLLDAMILCTRTLGFVNAPALMQRTVARLADVAVDIEPYRKRRELLCDGLEDIGYELERPEGTFYCFPRSPIPDEMKLIEALQNQLILAVPGRGFGAPGYFRLSLCANEDVIRRSLSGFRRVYESLTK